MMNARRIVDEAKRVVLSYGPAIRSHSGGRVSRILPVARDVLRVRTRYGMGPLYYSLYRFDSVPDSERAGYVDDGPACKALFRKASPASAIKLALDKWRFYAHCLEHRLPTIPIVCIVGSVAEAARMPVPVVDDIEQWRAAMGDPPAEMFVKSAGGSHGQGAFTITRIGTEYEFEGRRASLDDLFEHLRAGLKRHGAWLVQPRVRQPAAMSGITARDALPTIRAITCWRAGEPRLLLAVMKVTVAGSVTDNFDSGSSGNLLSAIDLDEGTLSSAWGPARRGGWPVIEQFRTHPDTGMTIEGFRLPFWNDAVGLALRAQASLPDLKTVGWDIALTEEGATLVEANGTYDLSILQIAHQRGLKDMLASTLEL